jgi:hypothetical protein
MRGEERRGAAPLEQRLGARSFSRDGRREPEADDAGKRLIAAAPRPLGRD